MEKNIDEAVKWLRKAAEVGNQEAMLKLSTLLCNDKRSFSEIIADYEAKIHNYEVKINKSIEVIHQWENAYNTASNALKSAENKYKKQLQIISEQEYTVGYNDAKAGKRNRYIMKQPKVVANKSSIVGNLKVGKIVKFGSYQQQSKDKKEPIKWRVLDIKDNKALIISEYALDCKKYNDGGTSASWKDCILRKWLNNKFLNNAFTNIEIETIRLSKVISDNKIETRDKIFILSVKEVDWYFNSYEDRVCEPSKIAQDNGVYTHNGKCLWWLRSIEQNTNCAMYVDTYGLINSNNEITEYYNCSVRPVLWINLKS